MGVLPHHSHQAVLDERVMLRENRLKLRVASHETYH